MKNAKTQNTQQKRHLLKNRQTTPVPIIYSYTTKIFFTLIYVSDLLLFLILNSYLLSFFCFCNNSLFVLIFFLFITLIIFILNFYSKNVKQDVVKSIKTTLIQVAFIVLCLIFALDLFILLKNIFILIHQIYIDLVHNKFSFGLIPPNIVGFVFSVLFVIVAIVYDCFQLKKVEYFKSEIDSFEFILDRLSLTLIVVTLFMFFFFYKHTQMSFIFYCSLLYIVFFILIFKITAKRIGKYSNFLSKIYFYLSYKALILILIFMEIIVELCLVDCGRLKQQTFMFFLDRICGCCVNN
ncbi:hypothetical protein TUBRATIS_20050 [Tubulinosema ratisbonensis]|uniref:Uncharacterized protein n=1 Tax=Tubulinosema ratisbonensis TaxID=291195 RepID=A0A437AK38_9MICR|nr:hypothetical protein TUBRATIS_20050 [Tubulinosema ratisbonensis]